MRNATSGPILDLDGLLGETVDAVSERCGTAGVDRVVGEDRWVMYEGSGWSLRVRARPEAHDAPDRVRSWTFTSKAGFADFPDACAALGLPEPDISDGHLRAPLPAGDRIHSLTARARGDRIHAVTAFDEPPDWLGGEEGTSS